MSCCSPDIPMTGLSDDPISIFHADQKKSAGGSSGCGGGAVTQLENALDVCDGEAAFADHKKCPDEIAHHVVEKAIAADGVDEFVAVALPLGEKDSADVAGFKSAIVRHRFVRARFMLLRSRSVRVMSGIIGFKICFCCEGLFIVSKNFFALFRVDGGEAGEVMLAYDDGGGLDHAGFRERIRMVVNIARLEWRANCSSIDVVAVSFGDSRASRMEVRRHFFRGKNAYGARKYVI